MSLFIYLIFYLLIYLFIYLLLAEPHACADDNDCHSMAKCQYGICVCQGKTTGNGKNCRGTVINTDLIEEKIYESYLP